MEAPRKTGRRAVSIPLLALACLTLASFRSTWAQQNMAMPDDAVEERAVPVVGEPAVSQPVADDVSRPRVVHADVVALDQLLVYNRFGSFNPYGMIFALRRDVQPLSLTGPKPGADECAADPGTSPGFSRLDFGGVRLRDCKRPRPLVLRANAGDVLEVAVTNLLRRPDPDPPHTPRGPDISHTWCGAPQPDVGTPPTRADERQAFEQQCRKQADEKPGEASADWPATRNLSFVLPGLEPLPAKQPDGTETLHKACLGLDAVPPGGRFTCRWRLEREGTHLFSSLAAPAGGEGDGGSLVNGLFGALLVEPAGSAALRSQVTRDAFDRVWAPRPPAAGDGTTTQGIEKNAPGSVRHARADAVRYDAAVAYRVRRPLSDAFPCAADSERGRETIPVLRVTRGCAGEERIGDATYRKAEIVHGDLNAIIVPPPEAHSPQPPAGSAAPAGEDARMQAFLERDAAKPFREFTVIFHDELKTFYADAYQELDQFGQLSGVRDGFAINYGASGLGTMLVANRKGIGPAAACPECQYEEFFLESWANGDPALLEAYPDDPSNVHHSYLNDKVVFRNLHAGPKETHVFHLHTHQWFAGNDQNRGAYLDSQTIGPQQGFTYRIYHGGHDRHAPDGAAGGAQGWWETAQGSGNRNRTPGDAIFHCHLYPHFAQGMWELWRVHDALEDGTRVLPDGQAEPGISVQSNKQPQARRPGSVDPETGAWLGGGQAQGTPIPGVVPIPGEAAPTLPTYTAPHEGEAQEQAAQRADGMPGFPFYIAGQPGHRTPQPPLDMAFDADSNSLLDGGLPRHVVTGGVSVPNVLTPAERQAGVPAPGSMVARMLALGDATSDYESLALRLLPHEGTRLERNAMAFHHDGLRRDAPGATALVDIRDAAGRAVAQSAGSYASPRLPRDPFAPGQIAPGAWFSVNGAPPAPGAPYANPCGAASGLAGTPYRRFLAVPGQGGQPGGFAGQTFAAAADPLVRDDPHLAPLGPTVPDPGLTGFRRFDVSAAQIDMVVNRAGWHDPQARIAVLTPDAVGLKEGGEAGVTKTARAEPFFFRAFSGECVELRHTNELPKDLDLDDFQLRVPTDTIGQHIHLVKFDVTSSDGSGNGFNYEDGTFAADEILARICAATAGRPASARPPVAGEAENRRVATREAECRAVAEARAAYEKAVATGDREQIAQARRGLRDAQLWWRARAGEARKYFQTTVQRWFADPILSNTGDTLAADRTLRTVFSHDHFSPSNIQQHGYYTALVIEPQGSSFCVNGPVEDPAAATRCVADAQATVGQPVPWDGTGAAPSERGDPRHVGTRATVFAPKGDVLHPDTREFALAIADFALLYDGAPQDRPAFNADTDPKADDGEEYKGLARLVGEAECRPAGGDGRNPDLEPAELVPAQAAPLCRQAAPVPAHSDQVAALRGHAEAWREAHGRPVAPPPRPEAISQKHHDPYLVNYRNEPAPLRLGAAQAGGAPLAFARNPCVVPNEAARPDRINHRDVRRQRSGEAGDVSNLFRSAWGDGWAEGHGDPCTPVFDVMRGDRVQFRLIQGAQEVQHMFTVEGRPVRRNPDQSFPAAIAGPAAAAPGRDVRSRCFAAALGYAWRPREYAAFLRGEVGGGDWPKIRQALARCDNAEGFVTAQEIGISEHFEFASEFRLDATFAALRRRPIPDARRAAPGETVQDNLEQVELNTSDFLVHFGTQDALWNGAWGLLRSHAQKGQDGEAVVGDDLTRCLAGTRQGRRELPADCLATYGDSKTPSIRDRLPPLGDGEKGRDISLTDVCPADGPPPVQAILFATRPAGGSTTYDPAQRLLDPDALVLLPLLREQAPAVFDRLLPPGGTPAAEAKPVPPDVLAALQQAAQAAPSQPRPLRVNAGQCLQLAVVNDLPSDTASDRRGDAPMPRIVPLNVDRDRAGSDADGTPDDPLYRVPGVSAVGQLRPSSHLALSVPLSGFDRVATIPLPYGLNATGALPPGQWIPQSFYAGRIAFKTEGGPSGNAELVPTPYAFGPLPVRSVADPFGHVSQGLFGVIVVEPEGTQPQPGTVAGGAGTLLRVPGGPEDGAPPVLVREHLLALQDGLNLHAPTPRRVASPLPGTQPASAVAGEAAGADAAKAPPAAPPPSQPVPNCRICDDSYDNGEKGISHRSAPFTFRLAGQPGVPADLGRFEPSAFPQSTADLNRYQFPPNFFAEAFRPIPTPVLDATKGEQVMIRVVHPGGRARQRSFSLLGAAYDDLFPGFGSGHAGLLAPGKALTAGICAPRVAGDYLLRDGPQHIFAGGAWGMLRVRNGPAAGSAACSAAP